MNTFRGFDSFPGISHPYGAYSNSANFLVSSFANFSFHYNTNFASCLQWIEMVQSQQLADIASMCQVYKEYYNRTDVLDHLTYVQYSDA